jgi:MinD-like ATPase involved in chromosome partitioning or flagellar assembly
MSVQRRPTASPRATRRSKERLPGRISTFYSYKGGTGRSNALANVAWILAAAGKRVLAIDWDLEAPGLHRYFHPFIADPDCSKTPGLIDFFVDFATAARIAHQKPEPTSDDSPWYLDSTSLLGYALPVQSNFPEGGGLDLVPAGRQDAGYSLRVTNFDWQSFYDELGGGVFLEALKRQLRDDYDYVLIDSRTGISDTSGVCTVQMPDDLVVCYTLNNQSIRGAAAVAESAHSQRLKQSGEPGLRIWPVAMRVELNEKDRLEAARQRGRDAFAKFVRHLRRDDRPVYWGGAEVLYQPYFAYEEVLAVFAERRHQTHSLLTSMEWIAARISNGVVDELPEIPEAQRHENLAKYVRASLPRQSGEVHDEPVFISYSSNERAVAERIVKRLEHARVGVAWDGDLLPGADWRAELSRALDSSKVVVAVLSPGTTTFSKLQLNELERAHAQGKPIVPVLIPGARVQDMPSFMLEYQALELASPRGRKSSSDVELDRLVSGVQRLLENTKLALAPLDPDDPQKGQFGGKSALNGRRLSASVSTISDDWFAIHFEVDSPGTATPLAGEVVFHLHPTFSPDVVRVEAQDGRAMLDLQAWGAFTVGVIADEGATRLELDLAKDSGFPRVFRER